MRRRLTPNGTLEEDEAAANAEGYGFGAGGGAKFSEDRGDVEFCGVIGNSKARGDLFVAEARGEHLQDFAFAAGERFGQFGEGLRSRCRGNGQGGLQIGGVEHDEADASGLQGRDKLIGSDIAGQNGADSGSQSFGGPTRCWAVGEKHDGGFRGKIGVCHVRKNGFGAIAGGVDQQDTDFRVGRPIAERIDVRGAADDCNTASCEQVLQARASQR